MRNILYSFILSLTVNEMGFTDQRPNRPHILRPIFKKVNLTFYFLDASYKFFSSWCTAFELWYSQVGDLMSPFTKILFVSSIFLSVKNLELNLVYLNIFHIYMKTSYWRLYFVVEGNLISYSCHNLYNNKFICILQNTRMNANCNIFN